MTRSFYQSDAGAKWDVLYHWLVWEQILTGYLPESKIFMDLSKR